MTRKFTSESQPSDFAPQPQHDTIVQDGSWKFDASVAEVFDDMLSRSIPQYGTLRDLTFSVGKAYPATHSGDIVDIGCSRGTALEPFVREFGGTHECKGVEISAPMAALARTRLRGATPEGARIPPVLEEDLRHWAPAEESCSLILAILTLQFVPIEYRQSIVHRMWSGLERGGAMILVEKVLGDSANLDGLFVSRYLDMKRANGYSQEQIDRKRTALEGTLVPITAHWNEDMLSRAGFTAVDCFWRWLNFAGWIAVKG